MNTILVSVIVPCYNQSQYLDECLQSVFEQTYTNWECIIVNDGSSDNTEEVASVWTNRDQRFRYVKMENAGVSSARNFGISLSSGEWILPLDGDDKVGITYLELASKYFKADYKVIYCNAEYFGSTTGQWYLPKFSHEMLALRNIIFCSAFFRRSDFEKASGYDEMMVHGYEDWEFWINLLSEGGEVIKLEEINFYYRKKNTSRQVDLDNSSRNKLAMLQYIHTKHQVFFLKHTYFLHEMAQEGLELQKVKASNSYKIASAIVRFRKALIFK